jgi:hypothetical protein
MRFNSQIVLSAMLFTGLTACIGDGTEGTDDDLGTAEQDVTSTQLTGLHSCSTGSAVAVPDCKIPLNAWNDFNTSCVLAGLGGDVNGYYTKAVVAPEGDHWYLYLNPGYGAGRTIKASAICTTPYGHASGGDWSAGSAAKYLGNTPGMQCFLQRLSGSLAFGANTDNVQVYQTVNGNWYLGGHQASGASLSATAACFVPTGGALWGWSYAWNNGTNTLNLTQNDPQANGVACGLNKIEGAFTSQTDKIQIWYDSQLTQWKTTLASPSGGHKAMEARCYN